MRALVSPLTALAFAALSAAAMAADENARDLAVIDRILAGVKPGQTLVELGDVGLTPEQLRAIRDRLAGDEQHIVTPPGTAFKWPGGIVYFRFANDAAITAARKQAFRDGNAEWAAFANLQFVELPSPPAAPGQTAFITVENDPPRVGGFSSSVGRSGAEQFVKIGGNSWNRGTIVHEMGHALGLWHEHQREDRDTYVEILWDNIPDAVEGNFVKVSTLGGGPGTSVGDYDFQSVMHYAQTTFGDPPGANTILPRPAYSQYLNNLGAPYDRTLSKLDRAGMAAIYGPPATPAGAVVTNTKDSGPGSLRTAIYFAWDRSTDVAPVDTTISFQIPTSDPNYQAGTFTIRPTWLLVAPGDGTTIDGATQAAFTGNTNASGPEIVINGSQIVAPDGYACGLRLRATECVVKELVINGFNQWGIQIEGAQATGNVVRGCYIGTDAAGTGAVPNAFPGIEISGGAHGNTIGGTTAAQRNVISGNSHNGIQIFGAGTDSNIVQGNFIGTNAAGTAALPNLYSGIEVQGGSKFTIVGGATAGAGNVISGNPFDGLRFRGAGTDNNVAQGNFFGLNAAGTGAVANQNSGVRIFGGAKANVVGGTSAAARNVISGNSLEGVTISESGTDNNSVLGNFIGLRVDGTAAVPNVGAGIGIFGGAKTNVIGGTSAAARNIISGNSTQGVLIANTGSNGNFVQGNFIGLNPAGTGAIPNGNVGVAVWGGAQSNTIGGAAAGAGNVISGNADVGVLFTNANTSNNVVAGNFIGTNAAGAAALPNVYAGLACWDGSGSNVIGGATPGARNVISGNNGFGVQIINAGAVGNIVQGNTIGGNASASGILPNTGPGVVLWGGAQLNVIGGTAAGTSNLIIGNGEYGVVLYDAATTGNSILGNSIRDNGFTGIALFSNANGNQAAPALTSAIFGAAGNPGGVTVGGSLTSVPSTSFRLEFFASPTGDPTGAGEGRTFLGAGVGTTNASGVLNFSAPLASAVPAGHVISATATRANGNTSPFATNRTVTVTDTDLPPDGIPDAWTQLYWGHPTGQAADNSLAGDDADGDGDTNLEELRAGTDPRNSSSRLTMTIDRVGNDARLTLPTVTGKTYRIDFAPTMFPADWRLLRDQLSGTGAAFQVTDPGALGFSARSYRATVVP